MIFIIFVSYKIALIFLSFPTKNNNNMVVLVSQNRSQSFVAHLSDSKLPAYLDYWLQLWIVLLGKLKNKCSCWNRSQFAALYYLSPELATLFSNSNENLKTRIKVIFMYKPAQMVFGELSEKIYIKYICVNKCNLSMKLAFPVLYKPFSGT